MVEKGPVVDFLLNYLAGEVCIIRLPVILWISLTEVVFSSASRDVAIRSRFHNSHVKWIKFSQNFNCFSYLQFTGNILPLSSGNT